MQEHWLGGKEFKVGKKKNNIFAVNSRVTCSGGKRETPILLAQSVAAGYEVYDTTRIFASRVGIYFRIDLQLSFRVNKRKVSHVFKADIQNVLNRQNVFGRYFDAASGTIRTSTQLGFIPIIGYRIEF